MDRSYEAALRIIDIRKRLWRPGAVSTLVGSSKPALSSGGTPDLRGTPSIVGMTEWLGQIGHSMNDINSLNIIHVAGTKGKGSTCAFAESFLRAHGRRTGYTRKTGLYTSPHLIHPEERIRLDSVPIDRTLFAEYFFEVYDRLPHLQTEYDPSKDPVARGPRYLQLYALLAFHVFIREKVDVAIMETHSGGEYDATNVVQKPVVTVVTTLGMDHIAMLGPTTENIAWHKAGIFKHGADALSAVQEAGPARNLRQRAHDVGEDLHFVDVDERLPEEALQLNPAVQRQNASLALAATEAFLSRKAPSSINKLSVNDAHTGVEQWSWPGRFQVVHKGNCAWFLDAAHNEMSVAIAAQWFAETASLITPRGPTTRVLIFSHVNELRDSATLLESLAVALQDCEAGVEHVIFTSYDTNRKGSGSTLEGIEVLRETWRKILPDTRIWEEPTVTGAIECVTKLAGQSDTVQTLITGSQHLVGPALQILSPGN